MESIADTKTETKFPARSQFGVTGVNSPSCSLTIRKRARLSSRLRESHYENTLSLVCRGNRGGTFYCVDTQTGKRTSLQTANEDEARQLLESRNNAARQPAMNLQIAQVYLQHGDPALSARTWQNVMEQIDRHQIRRTLYCAGRHAIRDKAFDLLRQRKLIETTAEHFSGTC